MTVPAGWKKRTNPNEYESILTDGQYKYEINANVQTGQRQIYAIDQILRIREFVGTVNADGTVVKREAWENISKLPNGQTRLKKIKDLSKVETNKLVAAVGTSEQKNRLKTQKEFTGLGNNQSQPTEAGAQESGPNATGVGIASTATASTVDLSNLENVLDKFENSNFDNIKQYLHYPENIDISYQDKIIITQIEYVPGRIGGALEGSLLNREVDFNEVENGTNVKQKVIGTVQLPMPNNISEENNTGWGDDSLSTIAAGMMGSVSGVVKNVMDAQFSAAFEDFKKAVSDVGSDPIRTRLERYLTAQAAASVLKFGGVQIDPEAYLTRATGTVINPNVELLFNGPKLRQFAFQFKMTPRSQKEAVHIRSIIKFFKKGMAPRRSKNAAEFIFLGTPNVFRIRYVANRDNEMGSIGKIKTCALNSCGINYTPDGSYASFDDSIVGSQPIAVTMQLGFTELTPIYSDEYDSSLTTVGPENIFNQFDVETPPEKNFLLPNINLANGFDGSFNLNGTNPFNDPGINIPFVGDPGPSRGGASSAASPTRVFQEGGSTATPPNSPNLGGGLRGA